MIRLPHHFFDDVLGNVLVVGEYYEEDHGGNCRKVEQDCFTRASATVTRLQD